MTKKAIHNKREAREMGLVWMDAKVTGGETTPALGSCRMTFEGAIMPSTSFMIWQMLNGASPAEAQKMWDEMGLEDPVWPEAE